MAAAVMTATFPVLAQNLPDGVYEEPVDAQGNSKGIAFKKSATLKPGTTDTYTIDLEAFVTGAVTMENKSVPADIVLVLDVSGSMNDHMYKAPYTAQSSQNYSYDTIYNLSAGNDLFYRYTDGNYYKVNRESQEVPGYDGYYYLRLCFTLNDGTKYYLTKDNRNNNIITTTPPTNKFGNGYVGYMNWYDTIWTGVLYKGTSIGSKISALHTAVKTFIDEIHTNDLWIVERDDDGNEISRTRRKDEKGQDTSLGNQISIVKFAGDTYYRNGNTTSKPNTDEGNNTYVENGHTYNVTQVVKNFAPTATEDDVRSLKLTVEGLSAAGATAADYGMTLAQMLFAELEDEDPDRESNKTVVFFTDGSPTYSSQFDSEVASNTIAQAYTLKSDYDATVFSIGVFDSISADLENYMKYVSSNYPDARNMSQHGNENTDPKELIYYQNASGADLSKIFQTVATASGGSGNTQVSGGSVVTVDVVASSFSLPKNVTADDITVKVAPCIGTQEITWTNDDGETITKNYLTFGDAKVSTDYDLQAITPNVNEANRTVSTTGFDFSANWCGPDENNTDPESIQPGYHGFKQIISFEIKVNPDAVGGPNVATNDKKSGIYVNGEQIAEFNRPTVKLPVSIWIKKQGLLGDDSAVFNIRYAPYQKGVDPTTIPKAQWKSFTKVMISKDSPKDKDGLPMEKLVGLDPNFFYRIDEDAWAWSYNYQDNGTQYTVGEDLVNPFKFVNKPKETVREAEASIRNVFEKKSSTTTTPTE